MARLIDVILPVYNAASTVREAISSLQQQTVKDIRIIIVDDGSTDQTPHILTEIANRDDRITLLRKSNSGIVEALNAGLELSRADFIARQDADDISNSTQFAEQLAHFQRSPDCTAVSGAVRHIDQRGRFTGKIQRFPPSDAADPFWAPAREPYLIHPFLLVRRSDIVAVGGYRHVHHAEDTDLYWRLRDRGRLHNLDTVLGDYRIHDQSISGASILNGRIMAVSSQLAALSARRRLDGRIDLEFRRETILEYRQAGAVDAIFRHASVHLDDNERHYLRIAIAGKLLELSAYRPYELELDDCRFIRDALNTSSLPRSGNLSELKRLQAGAGARLLRSGLFRHACTLTPPKLYFAATARLSKFILPEPILQFFTRVRGLSSKL